jgi:hypothetical protein
VTVDGANLDANSGHVTIGFKICDKSEKDPLTGKYIYTNAEGLKDDDHLDNLQSTYNLVHGASLLYQFW